MKHKVLLHNANVLTQAPDVVADSIAFNRDMIVAVGNDLRHDREFSSYEQIDLGGLTVVPGLVDAHTHFYFLALSLNNISVQNLDSLDATLKKIKKHADSLKKDDWLMGEGYAPDRFKKREEPDRYMLDKVSGGRPAVIMSKDEHSAWVNSEALEIANVDARTRDPKGGKIERYDDGTPTGILREGPAISLVLDHVPQPSKQQADRAYRQALELAYSKGVTGVHSFDSPDALPYFIDRAEKGTMGIRVNYYPLAEMLGQLERTNTTYGTGTEFFRIAGIKIFSDGSLGSQTALTFNQYKEGKGGCGIEVTTVPQMKTIIRRAAKLGFPCAIHAIGDKAVHNVLTAFEGTKRPSGPRHRIEHVQQIRRKDIARLKGRGVIASMQPSHCPSDIEMVRRYWGAQGRNAYIFRTLIDRGVDVAFGSDAPIEPLDPISGIADAVLRARPGSRDVFYPEERITAAEALYRFTVGSAMASGQAHERGRLLPGYLADIVILNDDITRVPPTRIRDVAVLGTIIGGKLKFADPALPV